jgi:hypothetical protein
MSPFCGFFTPLINTSSYKSIPFLRLINFDKFYDSFLSIYDLLKINKINLSIMKSIQILLKKCSNIEVKNKQTKMIT